jgi:predicted PurR-regulated permease PerM
LVVIAAGTILALLYFAKEVLIPLSLAALLSFLLAIPCSFLERRGFKRGLAVLTVVSLSLCLVGGLGWLAMRQFYGLARKLPEYHAVIESKLSSFKASSHSTVGKVNTMLKQAADEMKTPETNGAPESLVGGKAGGKPEGKPTPIPVEVHQPELGLWGVLTQMATPVLRPLATGFIVLVVLIFMLSGREDLRDRFIRLVGTERMDLTTDALDEAAGRVSRYLLMQLLVNCCFGLLTGTGLYFIGVPSPWLWGGLGVVLRFIPYAGPWISAVAPLLLAFAVDPGWEKLAWTGGLYVTVEIITANAVEPLLYGASTGVSPVALLLAAIFWTWLWGPVGLLLSTPLTVCLAVLGLHTRQLSVLHVLLGDEPVLTAETRFYQRMLAMDRTEAEGIMETVLKEKSLEGAYEEILIPALSFAKEDRARGRLPAEKGKFLLENMREVVEELEEGEEQGGEEDGGQGIALPAHGDLGPERVVVLPARDEEDEIAGVMLAQLLRRRGIRTRTLSAAALRAESLSELASAGARVVCISSVPPAELRRARYVWKKIRAIRPELKLVGAVWGATQNLDETRAKLAEFTPDAVARSFEEAVAAVVLLGGIDAAAPRSENDLEGKPVAASG